MNAGEKHRRAGLIVPVSLVVAATAGLILALLNVGGLSLSAERLYHSLARPLVRLMCYLAAGLLVGQLVESLGWTAGLARLVRPLTRWGHLKEESGAAFVASFLSGIVANTMLMNFYRDGRLSRRELVATYLVNNGLPIYLVHFPTTFFIVVSLAGKAGLVYLVITFLAAALRSVGALVYARRSFPPPVGGQRGKLANPLEKGQEITNSFWKKFYQRFLRLLLFTLPIYVLVFLLNDWGLFRWLKTVTAHWLSGEFFPIESAGMVIFSFAAEFSSGMATAGALLEAGTLTVKQAAISIIAGTIVSTPVRAIRHQLPTHAGIFNLALAGELLLFSQSLRILSLVLITIPYALWG